MTQTIINALIAFGLQNIDRTKHAVFVNDGPRADVYNIYLPHNIPKGSRAIAAADLLTNGAINEDAVNKFSEQCL